MGLLRITVDHAVRITATSARVHARVRGTSTLAGGLAARKAAEVREIVADLAARGVGEDDVEVTGVRLATGEGRLLKNQTVEISLAVAAPADRLPDVLGALSERPGVAVEHLEWVFEEFEASIPATAEAMAKARRKADAVAAAAGLAVRGLANASDSWSMPSPRPPMAMDEMAFGMARAAATPLDLGLELNATTELMVHLTVDFELSS